MIKIKYILSILIFLVSGLSAQNVELPSIILSGVPFNISASEIPDSVKKIEIKFKSELKSYIFNLENNNGIASQKFVIDESRNYIITNNLAPNDTHTISVIPGWLSIIPPLIAILLALIIRQVIVSLSLGIFSGALIYYNFNPLTALLRFADTLVLNVLIDKDHMFIIVFTLLIGGVVGLISANGGTAGLAQQITKLAKTTRSGKISSWLLGVMIFFDDYANSLIIGNTMRPITDKLKISREKLAYIVDSTAAPVASIVIISTWVGYEVGLISDGLNAIGSAQNAYDVFISSIPYGFYPIATIYFVFLTSFWELDFGPMLRFERKASIGKVVYDDEEIETNNSLNSENAKWYNGAIPIFVILFGTIISLVATGIHNLQLAGISEYSVQNIINHADSFSSLLWASFGASIVAIVMTVSQRILSLNDAIEAWQKGIQSMLVAVIILVFAWTISAITTDLKTADFIISLLSDSIDPRLLPAIVFIICAAIGFSTGTSWGTMAIVMPIVIPLTYHVGNIFGLDSESLQNVLFGVISSVLAGSVFGDHCSPIADTTILSSLASKCNHIDHVKTQLPYAILVGIFSVLFGSIPAAYDLNPFISIAILLVALTLFLKIFGKKV
ncbi:MAG: Na+/H+ antiporter NhaC family protein [Bacteroidetes bacterium]|nr:Na+/H+ antiporter NhaC family protein [Bacteroidota bacterium]MBU1115813.1 Na+/H+ antiporter NhaC family protein [Bacteroidota bacterium]MBU1800206.1 Na+/H+ antiporter NhaC family protein [Bacteroidota bacterium]